MAPVPHPYRRLVVETTDPRATVAIVEGAIPK